MPETKPDGHVCFEHLRYRQSEWTETHGLDCGPYEHCFQEWWECAECGEIFTAQELEIFLNEPT